MVFDAVPAIEARHLGLGNNRFEVAILSVIQYSRKVTALPILMPAFIRLPNLLERRYVSAVRLHHVIAHLLPPSLNCLTTTLHPGLR